jgi:pyridoxine kinase
MAYKRILTIQDISCVGQCSMTVALPILSACGHETCILPTAVLSTHTGGFGKPVVQHLDADGMWRHWKNRGITFDAILVGYLGSVSAIDTVAEILDELLAPGGIAIVDPAMADHGKLYSGFDKAYAVAMQFLCEKADIMLPNITEAAMMADMDYPADLDEAYIRELLEKLGGGDVILTGAGFEENQTGAAVRTNGNVTFYHHPRLPGNFSGTGDMFAACFTGALMQGKSMEEAVQIASEFVCRSICATMENPAHWYGVKFETALPWLINALF